MGRARLLVTMSLCLWMHASGAAVGFGGVLVVLEKAPAAGDHEQGTPCLHCSV